ncbi:DNA replication and repair protein RecF [Rubritalea halochordaticola]|uniref:DNA replication and repair protein RecF n=1 Tax=Rubritalea halochordaticola TaxID=714537 RepID=A0ABP9UZE5_9BACT
MLTSLRLLNFRCFESLSLELPEEGALFVGHNAQGKTSILEAVCVLVRLHSPRAKSMRPLMKFDASEFGIAGEGWERDLQVRHSRAGSKMLIDGEELKTQGEYLENGGLVVWMGNEDVELVRGSGGSRRRYLDFICSQLDQGYRRALSRYRRALKARNLLLKEPRLREDSIQAYTEILIEHGEYITSARQHVLTLLAPHLANTQKSVSGREEILAFEYQPGSGGSMVRAFESTAESERRQRQTLAGPHRDDFKILLNGFPAGDYASEGQQRTIALAMKLAQGDVLRSVGGKMPVYLLDDIFGELDLQRRNALMRYLPKSAQKLITTTNLDWMDQDLAGWSRYLVDAGTAKLEDS